MHEAFAVLSEDVIVLISISINQARETGVVNERHKLVEQNFLGLPSPVLRLKTSITTEPLIRDP